MQQNGRIFERLKIVGKPFHSPVNRRRHRGVQSASTLLVLRLIFHFLFRFDICRPFKMPPPHRRRVFAVRRRLWRNGLSARAAGRAPRASRRARPFDGFKIGRGPSVGRAAKLIPDATHLAKIEEAVHRVHRATLLATELANLHLRRLVREGKRTFSMITGCLTCTTSDRGAGSAEGDRELRKTAAAGAWSPCPRPRRPTAPASRVASSSLGTVAKNNVWSPN